MISHCRNIYQQGAALVKELRVAAVPLAIYCTATTLTGGHYLNAAYSTLSGVKASFDLTKDTYQILRGRAAHLKIPAWKKIALDLYFIYMSYFSYKAMQLDDAEADLALGAGLVLGSAVALYSSYQKLNKNEITKSILPVAFAAFSMYNGLSKLTRSISSLASLTRSNFHNDSYHEWGRYPKNGLYQSFSLQDADNSPDNNIAILQAKWDWNGALNHQEYEPAFETFYSQHKYVYFDDTISKKSEMCAALEKAKSLFHHPISILYLRVHGNPARIVFTDPAENDPFIIDTNMPVSDYSCINDALAPNATIIFHTCSGGMNRWFGIPNIAEWFSRAAKGRTVVASKDIVYPASLRYNYQDKNLDLKFMSANLDYYHTVTYRTLNDTAPTDNFLLRKIDETVRPIVNRLLGIQNTISLYTLKNLFFS